MESIRESVLGRGASHGAVKPRIAIASSGLGHINRGIEAWAADTAAALQRAGYEATLFQGAGEPLEPWRAALPCRRRFDPETARVVERFRRLGGWRYGLGSGYSVEQLSFAWGLWPRIRRDYELLHVQDPWLAVVMDRLHRLGLSRPRVILAHGTEEPPAFLRRCSILQHLAPCYVDEWRRHQPRRQQVFAVPNFVDVRRFRPGDRVAARQGWALPQDHLIVLSVAAIKRHHKRIDALLREFAAFQSHCAVPATLVVAGGREAETDEVVAMGRELLGERVRFLEGVSREKIAGLYQAADVFTLASLHEMMPIALLEALASGLPAACNDTPTLRWMAGPAGELNDISREGALAEQLLALLDPERRAQLSRAARAHAEATFSEDVVVNQVLEMYRAVMAKKR